MLDLVPLFMRNVDDAFFDANLTAMLCRDGGIVHGGDHIAGLDLILVLHLDLPIGGNVELVMDHFTVFDTDEAHICILIRLDDADRALDLGNDGFTFRHLAGLEELFHTGETSGDITTSRNTTGM